MINRMMMSSGSPRRPIMMLPFRYEDRRDSTTLLRASRFGGASLLMAALLAVPLLSAQFTSGVNLVEVYAAVTDQAGNPVTGLSREDFSVLEDGQPQAVSAFAEADFPLSVAVGIDRSFSMAPRRGRGRPQFLSAPAAARTFLGELRPQDQSMIVAIGSEVEVVAPLSNDRAAQLSVIAGLGPWGTTGLYDAIIKSIDAIQEAKGRRAMILLSDGGDRYSKATAADALARARRSDVIVYPVTIGSTQPPLFAQLATLTGGRSFHPRSSAELDTVMRTIANELRHQYMLGYSPAKPIVGGEPQWRAITVRVNRPGVTVRARDGYLAK
jgi:Ca-activated chloride channel homolog